MPTQTTEKGATETPDRRATLAKAMIRMFDEWQLSTADRLVLLGLAPDNRAALARYSRGVPLSNSRDTLDRAGHLLAIYKNLKLLFPRNENFRNGWMTASNTKFGGKRPVDVVADFGLTGLALVRATLDRMRGS